MIASPATPEYDSARAGFNLIADLRPAAAAIATSVQQVQEALAYAADNGLRVAPCGTGHLSRALPALDDVLLLKVVLEGERVAIDPDRRTARVRAGALWGEVVEAAAEHGLIALHGSSPTVGVMGYLLAGGVSMYARQYGIAANHVRAFELVTADGRHLSVDADNEPELFWALRGGGGSFGVVTAVELDLFALETIYAGTLFWPVAHARDVLRAWNRWTDDAPPEISTAYRILCLPPIPEVPEPLRGVPVVAVDGVLIGDTAAGEALLAPLRAAAPPMIDTWAEMPAAGAGRVHGDPEQPIPGIGGSAVLTHFDDDAIDAFLAAVGEGSGSPLLSAELRQLGGALATAPDGAGVTGSLPFRYLMFGVGVPMTGDMAQQIAATLDAMSQNLAPWLSGRQYMGFNERPDTSDSHYDPDVYARLLEVREAWDPQRRLVGSHDLI